MARLFVQYLAFLNNKSLHKSIKNVQNKVQISPNTESGRTDDDSTESF